LNFRRVLDLGNVPDNISNINRTDAAPGSVKSPDMFGPLLRRNSLKRKRGENQGEMDEVSLFRRVRIYNIVHGLVLPNPPRSDLLYRAKLYELRNTNGNSDWHDRGTGFVDIRPELKVEQLTFLVCKYFQEPTLREILTQTKQAERQLVILSVKSEDAPYQLLLSTQLTPEHGFQKQQGKESISRSLLETG
jgi:hypothetical protein